ncbi:hypothetical protein [Ornithinibacillus salinisoli]
MKAQMKRKKFQTVVHSNNESPNGEEKITNGYIVVTSHFTSNKD